jgi:hypothetical protein
MANTPDSRSDRRRPHLALPVEPTDDELARNWTLSEADRIEVLRYRGDGSRLRFAIQLCALRARPVCWKRLLMRSSRPDLP